VALVVSPKREIPVLHPRASESYGLTELVVIRLQLEYCPFCMIRSITVLARAKKPSDKWLFYRFEDVHVPVRPSDRLNVPEPLRPEARPVLMTVMPL
jgi:hypothetical protein